MPQVLQQLQASGQLPTLDVTPTLAGTDTDKNGVRDDLDKYIAALPDTAMQKKALTQMAAAVQTAMVVDLTNAGAVTATSTAINRGTSCIFQQYQAPAAAKAYLMEELSVNTLMRLTAYERFNTAMSGTTVALTTSAVCN